MSSKEMSPNFSVSRYTTGDKWVLPPYSELSSAPALSAASMHEAGHTVASQQLIADPSLGTGGLLIRAAMELVNPVPAVGESPLVDDLFSQLRGSTLSSALHLLNEALAHSQRAFGAIDSDPVSADDEMQQLQAILPELFCCRSIGDGFGALVNSIQYALVNREGFPLTKSQISLLLGAIRKLREAPFISFGDAVNLAMTFEDAELVIDPPALSHLADEPTE